MDLVAYFEVPGLHSVAKTEFRQKECTRVSNALVEKHKLQSTELSKSLKGKEEKTKMHVHYACQLRHLYGVSQKYWYAYTYAKDARLYMDACTSEGIFGEATITSVFIGASRFFQCSMKNEKQKQNSMGNY